MLKALFTVLCLLWTSSLWAAIAYDAGDVQSGSVVPYVEIYPNNVSGATCVTFGSLFQGSGALTITSVVDDDGSIWTQQTTATAGSTRVEVWTTMNVLGPSENIAAVLSSALDETSVVGGCWTGVAGIGTTATATGTSTAPAVALVTQDANNFVVSAFAAQGATTVSANVGNLRHSYDGSGGGGSQSIGLVDNTAASASSVNTSLIFGTPRLWVALAIELRSTLGIPPASTRQRSVIILP